MKKYNLIIYTFLVALISIITVNAREMTITELGNIANAQYTASGKEVSYIYVIGEYAFTSEYSIKAEDIMLAANSITSQKDAVKYKDSSNQELSDDYKMMIVDKISATYNETDYSINGWKVDKAIIGTSKLESAGTAEAKVKIRYIDYNYIGEPSTFTAGKPSDDAEGQIESTYGWNKEVAQANGYSVDFTQDGNTIKVSGLVPKVTLSKNNIFAAEHLTGYYFVYSLNIANVKTETTIKIGAHNNGLDPEKVIPVTEEDENYELVFLMHVHPEEVEKTTTITVDLDGEDSKDYAPYEIILDYSGLTLASDTKPGKVETPTIENKEDYYNFDSTKNEVTINANTLADQKQNYDLTGTIKKQTVSSEAGFDTTEGFFIVIRIYAPSDSSNWTLGLHRPDGSYYQYTPTSDEYSQGYVDVLFTVSRDGQKYTEDGEEADTSKTIRYQIDADGVCNVNPEGQNNTGCEFDSVTVIIDYSNVEFDDKTE